MQNSRSSSLHTPQVRRRRARGWNNVIACRLGSARQTSYQRITRPYQWQPIILLSRRDFTQSFVNRHILYPARYKEKCASVVWHFLCRSPSQCPALCTSWYPYTAAVKLKSIRYDMSGLGDHRSPLNVNCLQHTDSLTLIVNWTKRTASTLRNVR